MTTIFNERTKIVGVGVVGEKLAVQVDPVANTDSLQLMTDILKELKIMNLHLSLMTDTLIGREEVE